MLWFHVVVVVYLKCQNLLKAAAAAAAAAPLSM